MPNVPQDIPSYQFEHSAKGVTLGFEFPVYNYTYPEVPYQLQKISLITNDPVGLGSAILTQGQEFPNGVR